jgi:HK97 gp10 family phage protein
MEALPKRARELIGKALEEGADEIASMQRRLVPVGKTGRLKASIKVTKGGAKIPYSQGGSTGVAGDPDLSYRISAGNSEVRYAHRVEFGTAPHTNKGFFEGSQHPGARPRPFFFPAYRALKRKVRSRITRATKQAVKEIAGT